MSDEPNPTTERQDKTAFKERLDTKPQKPGLLHRIAAVWKDAFVMYPTAFATQDKTVDLVGAPEVNRKIREWVARAKELDAAGLSPEEASVEEEAELPSVLRKDSDDG